MEIRQILNINIKDVDSLIKYIKKMILVLPVNN